MNGIGIRNSWVLTYLIHNCKSQLVY